MFQKVQNFFKSEQTNEYGYKPHNTNKRFFKEDNPWLYIVLLIVGLGLSYLLVNISMY